MKANVRSCIAYGAWRCISGKQSSGIFDTSQSKLILMSGSVASDHLDFSDKEESCHFSGDGSDSRFSLYNDCDGHHVTLTIRGDCFYGYDYGSSSNFSGKIQGDLLNLYDCEDGSSVAFRMGGSTSAADSQHETHSA
jgi:hypothetical protein